LEDVVPHFDLPLEELRRYAPDLGEPDDLDAFWRDTLADARTHDLEPTFERVDNGLALIETFDVSFTGFGEDRIRGWLHRPLAANGRLPAVVEFLGYGGGRGLPHEKTIYAQAGFVHLVMDTRGQGSGWSVGDTADPGGSGAPSQPGFMTRGILDPADYYYRRVYVDAVRAVETARAYPAVDPGRVAITGASQGGGITIAVASLVGDLAGAAPDVPFLSHFERAIGLVETNPYMELVRYLAVHRDHTDSVLRTLSYFDVARLAKRAKAPALFSVALMDDICPPSTVFAAFNAYGGSPKEISEYAFNRHEGGQAFHDVAKLRWLAERLGKEVDA
jgi:cephalosporin-C deacetylase